MSDLIALLLLLNNPQNTPPTAPVRTDSPGTVHTNGGGIPIQPKPTVSSSDDDGE